MKRFVQGETRSQMSLLPECLDDYVSEDNPVRVVEAFIGALDLAKLGFSGMAPQATGRPAYHPSMMLKEKIASLKEALAEINALEPELNKREDKTDIAD